MYLNISKIVVLTLMLAACASPPRVPIVVSPPSPGEGEVVEYVTRKWAEYAGRFANFATRRNAPSTLITVSNVVSSPYYGVSNCTFEIQARFEDGSVVSRRLSSQFDRDAAGAPEEVVLLIH